MWASIMLLIITLVLHFAPEAAEAMGSALGGMKLENSPIGFFDVGEISSFGNKELNK